MLYNSSMQEVAVITTSQVARHYGVDNSTVRRWVADGKLTPALRTPGGHYRFLSSDLDGLHDKAAV